MSKTVAVNAVLLVLSIGLAVCGQLSMKAGMNKVGEITAADFSEPFELIGRVARSPWAVTGIILYAVSAVFWLIVLSRVNLSVAYPLVAAGYVVVVLYSWLVFKESVRWFSWIGLGLIVIGVIIAAQGLKSGENGDKDSLKPSTVQVAGETAPSPDTDTPVNG
ncbi:MAG: EamA family transporter [Actinobacteria bacterium]|nr:EamA family transporter [Actinomycetota bacterium]